MNTNLKIIYQLVIVPLRSTVKFFTFLVSLIFLSLSLLYVFAFPHILDLDILKTSQSDIASIKEFIPKNNTKIYDDKNNLINEQFNQYHLYVPYQKIPKKMTDAILAVEDRKFFEHAGIDIFGIMRAVFALFAPDQRGYSQGASTITQQVVKNLLLSKEKTITRKVREIVLALYLEQSISKEKILEIYCNHLFLGNGAYGVAAAAKRYFNKSLDELNYHETALIAGLFQSPAKYNPFNSPTLAKQRQTLVLKALLVNNNLNINEYHHYHQKKLAYQEYRSTHGKIAPYYVDYILESAQEILNEKGIDIKDSGLKIHTTLNQELQGLAENTIKESDDIFDKMKKHVLIPNEIEAEFIDSFPQAALLVIDRRSGEIVAMQGGRDYQTSQFNRAVHALRAPGSVFKPITYTYALKNGHLWNDQHYVSPITIGNYRPRSSHSKLYSQTTLLEAFYESINSPAVEIGAKLGLNNIIKFGYALGVETPIKEEASSLLGSSEVSMLDMARVYTTLANNGQKLKLKAITRIEDKDGKIIYSNDDLKYKSEQIVDADSNQLIVEGLKQVIERGTGYKARFLSGFAAGKTGTSNQSKDNWFCGFTNDLVVISWMGNDNQYPFKGYISASNTATPLWARYIDKANRLLKTAKLEVSSQVEVAYINPHHGNLDKNGIPMYFKPEQLPQEKISDLLFLERGQSTRMDFDEF